MALPLDNVRVNISPELKITSARLKGVPEGWKLIGFKRRTLGQDEYWYVMCEREEHQEKGSNYVTWTYYADPEKVEAYESTCTSGTYRHKEADAVADFNKL